MSIKHNRIKVSDLETNQPNKILITNENGELEFSDFSNAATEFRKENFEFTASKIFVLSQPAVNVLSVVVDGITLNGTSGAPLQYRMNSSTELEILDEMILEEDIWVSITYNYTGSINSSNGVQSVTGDGVDNTDPQNPVITGGAIIENQIVEGVTDKGVSQNAVFNALSLKADDSNVLHSKTNETFTGTKSANNSGSNIFNGMIFNQVYGSGTPLRSTNSDSGSAIELINNGTSQAAFIANYTSGIGINVFNNGSGNGLYVNNNGSGNGVQINITGATNPNKKSLLITDNTSSNNGYLVSLEYGSEAAASMPFRVTRAGATTYSITNAGIVTASSFKTPAGLPNQSLQADGSLFDLNSKIDKEVGKSLLADTEISRLSALSNYTHPANHPASIITQDPTNRFVTDAEKAIWNTKQASLGFIPENSANKNAASGYAGLGTDGKLLSSQLPSITVNDTFVIASQDAMLALSTQTGDIAVRTDLNKSFILKGTNPTLLSDWQELLTPTSAVTTVFGRNGAVVQQAGDYTADQISETTTRKFQTANQQIFNDATSSIQTQLNNKEASFAKNTAFNKNFGNSNGTVAEGNDSRIINGQTSFSWGNHSGLYAKFNGDSSRFNGDVNTLGLSGSSGIYNVSNASNLLSGYGTLYAFFNTDISTQLHLSYNGDAYWRKSIGGTYSGSTWRTFLDSTNYSSYAINRNGDTVSGHLSLYSTDTSGSYNTRAIELREVNQATTTDLNPYMAPSIGFHWGGVNQCQLAMISDGSLVIRSDSGNGNKILHTGNYNAYSPSLSGDGASGTWGININGNSSSVNNGFYQKVQDIDVDSFSLGTNLYRGSTSSWSNQPSHTHNGNALLNIDTHPGNYVSQLWFDTGGETLRLRNSQNGVWGNWKTFITSGNIGEQSVNYANHVDWSGINNKENWLSTGSLVDSQYDANSWKNSGFYENSGSGVNWPTNGTWYNSINVRHSNQSNYHGFQAAMSFYDNKFWFRSYQGSGTFQAWEYAISNATIGSQSVNYANSAGSAPNGDNSNAYYNVTPGDGNGIQFWSSSSYKISMGASSLYTYGPVNDYSIKMQMDDYSPGRGFTWGRESYSPIAALNAASGNFQTAGTISAAGDITAYYSDERLKQKIGVIENPIDKVKKLSAFYYVNNKLANDKGYTDNRVQLGLSAQEVKDVLPEIVTLAPFDTKTNEDGTNESISGEDYLTVNYAKIVPLLIEAIKEQQIQIENLTKKINTK